MLILNYCNLLLWDMDRLCRVTKRPCQYSKAIAPSRWMVSSKISAICVICNAKSTTIHTLHGMEGIVLTFGRAIDGQLT
jgi:hypothetical protein